MKSDRREFLTVVAGTEAAANAPDEALAEAGVESGDEEEVVYTLDTLPRSCFWTWDEVYAALAPHEAEILAAENRVNHPVRRPSHKACRLRARRSARPFPPTD